MEFVSPSSTVISFNKGWRRKRKIIIENLYPYYRNVADVVDYHYSSFDFREHDQLDLTELSYCEQENKFYDDLIAVFWGYNTRNIACYKEDESIHWWVNDLADPTLTSTVRNCLPLAEILKELKILLHKIKFDKFRGTIAHKVCAVCNKELKNRFYPFLEKKSTEKDKLVSRFLNDLQEFDGLFKMMFEIVRDIDKEGYIGGQIISYLDLAGRKHATNPNNIFAQMIKVTLAQYFKILFEWLTNCSVDCDIMHEFMIWDLRKTKLYKYSDFIKSNDREERFEGADPEFDERFVIIADLCPSVLESVFQKIVRSGKYLFVAEKNTTSLIRTQISINERSYEGRVSGDIRAMVEQTCREAGELLLKRLRDDFDVTSALNTFFLGSTINWLTYFIYISDDYLDKEVEKIVTRTMNIFLVSALEKTLQTSNRFSRNFKCVLLPSKLYTEVGTRTNPLNIDEDLYGPSLLCLTIEVNSNLRMLLPKSAEEKYMRIFRICYKIQRAMFLLNKKNFFDPQLRFRGRKEKLMIFNMSLLLNKFYGFWFVYTIPPLWEEFSMYVKELTGVEDLIDAQAKMLNDIFDQCGFDQNTSDFLSRVILLVDIIVLYAKNRITFDEAYPAFDNLFKELHFQAVQDARFTELAFHVFRNGASENGGQNDSVVFRL